MHGRRALFAPADVQPAGVDLDLVPLQIAKLGSWKPVAVGQQDHGGVPMAIAAVLARGLDQPLDLATGESRFPSVSITPCRVSSWLFRRRRLRRAVAGSYPELFIAISTSSNL